MANATTFQIPTIVLPTSDNPTLQIVQVVFSALIPILSALGLAIGAWVYITKCKGDKASVSIDPKTGKVTVEDDGPSTTVQATTNTNTNNNTIVPSVPGVSPTPSQATVAASTPPGQLPSGGSTAVAHVVNNISIQRSGGVPIPAPPEKKPDPPGTQKPTQEEDHLNHNLA